MAWVKATAAELVPGTEVRTPMGFPAETVEKPKACKGVGTLVLVRYTGGRLVGRDARLQVADLWMERS